MRLSLHSSENILFINTTQNLLKALINLNLQGESRKRMVKGISNVDAGKNIPLNPI